MKRAANRTKLVPLSSASRGVDQVSQLSFDVRCRILIYLNYKGLRAIQFLNSTWRNTLMEFEPDETGEDADCSFGVFRHKITTVLYGRWNEEEHLDRMSKWVRHCFRTEEELKQLVAHRRKFLEPKIAELNALLDERCFAERAAFEKCKERIRSCNLHELYAAGVGRSSDTDCTVIMRCVLYLVVHIREFGLPLVFTIGDLDAYDVYTYYKYAAADWRSKEKLANIDVDTITSEALEGAAEIKKVKPQAHWDTSVESMYMWCASVVDLAKARNAQKKQHGDPRMMLEAVNQIAARGGRYREMAMSLVNAALRKEEAIRKQSVINAEAVEWQRLLNMFQETLAKRLPAVSTKKRTQRK